ncbi:MAG: hypothetical protein ACP5E2_15500 [Terracidiphilus sp.]
MSRLGRWMMQALIGFALASLVTFAVDWTAYKLRGSPHSSVVVNRYMAVPLKGQKTEYDYLGTANVSCAVALFPEDDRDPCWYVRRHANQWEDLGAPKY